MFESGSDLGMQRPNKQKSLLQGKACVFVCAVTNVQDQLKRVLSILTIKRFAPLMSNHLIGINFPRCMNIMSYKLRNPTNYPSDSQINKTTALKLLSPSVMRRFMGISLNVVKSLGTY